MASKDPRPALDLRAERTRQLVLAAAQQLLLEEGWDAVTHVRLAAATGISRMTLYRHWPTRIAMMKEAMKDAVEGRHATVSGDVRTDLTTEMQLMRTEILAPPGARMLAMLLERAQLDPEVAGIRSGSVHKACSGLVRVLQAAVDANVFAADLDIDAAVTRLAGPCVHQLLANGKPLTASFVNDVVAMFLHRFEATSAAPARPCTPST
jgi:AcrR family transcriptional regulator